MQVNLKVLMQTKPEELAKLQFIELKLHTLEILNKIIKAIKEDDFEKVNDMIFYSPAGDDYGRDNYCIDFNYGDGEMDINDVTCLLENLKKQIKDGGDD